VTHDPGAGDTRELHRTRASAADVDSMSRRELLSLAERSGKSLVSLYLSAPSDSPSPKRRMEWTNLIRAAARQLRADGISNVDVDRTLKPAGRAFDRDGSDRQRDAGWVYFAGTHWRCAMRVPVSVPRLAVAGDRYYVAPLVPLLARKEEYFLLELRGDDFRLYAGNRVHLARVPLEGLALGPLASMPPGARTARAFAAGRSGSDWRAFADGIDDDTEVGDRRRILEHFRRVDAGILDMFRGDEPALVLGGVAHLRSLYREVNSYSRLLDGDVESGPQGLAPTQLHARSWPIVEPTLHRSERQAIGRFKQLHGSGRTLTDAHQVAIAAEEGRVETLIIASDATTRAQDSHKAVRLSGTLLSLERAVAGTLRAGGDVHVQRNGRMPGRTTVAAILRS
jgi:hypothetical protein